MDTTLDQTERRRSRRLLGICCSTHVAHDGLSDMLYVLLPVLAEQFGLTLAQVGLIRGAHRTAMSLFQIPAGLLSERLGERILLVGGTALAGAAFIAYLRGSFTNSNLRCPRVKAQHPDNRGGDMAVPLSGRK